MESNMSAKWRMKSWKENAVMKQKKSRKWRINNMKTNKGIYWKEISAIVKRKESEKEIKSVNMKERKKTYRMKIKEHYEHYSEQCLK